MKQSNIRFITCLFGVVFLLVSCGKTYRNATIVRDCTGTYIQLNDRDYLVCNPTTTNTYQDGSSVKVKFDNENSCNFDPNVVTCELYHKSYGFVKITEIN